MNIVNLVKRLKIILVHPLSLYFITIKWMSRGPNNTSFTCSNLTKCFSALSVAICQVISISLLKQRWEFTNNASSHTPTGTGQDFSVALKIKSSPLGEVEEIRSWLLGQMWSHGAGFCLDRWLLWIKRKSPCTFCNPRLRISLSPQSSQSKCREVLILTFLR